MNTALTSDLYLAINSAHGLTFNKTLRILCRVAGVETITPARWNAGNARLESVAVDTQGIPIPIPMYEAGQRLRAKLNAAGYCVEYLTLDQAKTLTS